MLKEESDKRKKEYLKDILKKSKKDLKSENE